MAFNDTLFQLGMDLTRSSTAQKEDIVAGSARVESGDRKNFFAEREGVQFAGSHLIVDLIGAKSLDDAKHVDKILKGCVAAAHSMFLGAHLHRSPVKGAATFDIYMASDADAFAAVEELRVAFKAREAVLKAHKHDQALPPFPVDLAGRKAKRVRVAAPARARKAA
jgi:S-adenosylmethionine decarboxylase